MTPSRSHQQRSLQQLVQKLVLGEAGPQRGHHGQTSWEVLYKTPLDDFLDLLCVSVTDSTLHLSKASYSRASIGCNHLLSRPEDRVAAPSLHSQTCLQQHLHLRLCLGQRDGRPPPLRPHLDLPSCEVGNICSSKVAVLFSL